MARGGALVAGLTSSAHADAVDTSSDGLPDPSARLPKLIMDRIDAMLDNELDEICRQ